MSDPLARLNWQDFEHLLAEHYREQGYRVEIIGAAAALKTMGSGLDLRLRRGNDTLVVQCRHWDAREVPGIEVTELLGTMLNEAATGGVIVTRGVFSAEARLAAGRQPRLQLVDGDRLRTMLNLPAHLGPSMPATAKVSAPAMEKVRRRASASAAGSSSKALPVALVLGLAALLLIFVWKIQTDRHDPNAIVPTASADPVPAARRAPAAPLDATPADAGIAAAPMSVAAPSSGLAPDPAIQPARPAGSVSGFVSRPAVPFGPPPVASHELAERQRLSKEADDPRRRSARSEDAMKVLENNTREVGQAH